MFYIVLVMGPVDCAGFVVVNFFQVLKMESFLSRECLTRQALPRSEEVESCVLVLRDHFSQEPRKPALQLA